MNGQARAGWDVDLAEGVEREDAFARVMKHGTVEHKRDYGCLDTGNLYVEYRQTCSDGTDRPSGIAVSTADYWAFEFAEEHWLIVPTEGLRALAREVYRKYPNRRVKGGDGKKTEGVLLPIAKLVQGATK